MADSLRELRSKIKSTESMKKITRAMELIAASRIVKAQQRARAAAPYARELTRSVEAIATYANVDHPLTTEPEDVGRAAVLVITSDRGLAGAYSTSVIKEAESLIARLREEGKEVELYVTGRKAQAYYAFRDRRVVDAWTGFSDQPSYSDAKAIGEALIASFIRDEDDEAGEDEPGGKGVGEVHVVFTKFQSMISQEPITIRMLPLEIVEADEAPSGDEVLPLYEFEPSASEVLDSLLPKYVQSRIYFALLQAAASELAARQKAMKSATDNAEDLIEKYKRVANQARQAAITQEISEIVGGVEALSGSNGRGE